MSTITSVVKKDFKYCIWLVPKKKHKWHKYTNGFVPHMTVKSEIDTKGAAYALYAKVALGVPKGGISVKMIGELEQHNENDFNALIYNLEQEGEKNMKNMNIWWPTDPHVSLAYQYDKKFETDEMKKIDEKIIVGSAILNEVRIMCCSGHFEKWQIVNRIVV